VQLALKDLLHRSPLVPAVSRQAVSFRNYYLSKMVCQRYYLGMTNGARNG